MSHTQLLKSTLQNSSFIQKILCDHPPVHPGDCFSLSFCWLTDTFNFTDHLILLRAIDWCRLITLEERRYIREKIKAAYQSKTKTFEELLELSCAIEEEFVFASAPSRLDYFKSGTSLFWSITIMIWNEFHWIFDIKFQVCSMRRGCRKRIFKLGRVCQDRWDLEKSRHHQTRWKKTEIQP